MCPSAGTIKKATENKTSSTSRWSFAFETRRIERQFVAESCFSIEFFWDHFLSIFSAVRESHFAHAENELSDNKCRENAMWEALTVFASFGRPFHRIVLFIILLFIVWPRNEMENSKFIACRSRRSFTQLRQWCRCDQKPLFLIVDQNEFCPKNANRTKVEIQLSQSQSAQSIRCGFSLFFFLLFRVIHELVHTQTYARAVSLTVNKLCWNQMSGKPYVLFSRSCAMSAWKTS